jgi:hypothetical protein
MVKRKARNQIGQESNWRFDSQPLKVRNRPDFLTCRWHATYHSKDLDKGYNFSLDFISIGGLQKKVMGPQSCESPKLENFGTPTWESSGTKSHLDVAPVERHKVYYKGKVVASPKSELW